MQKFISEIREMVSRLVRDEESRRFESCHSDFFEKRLLKEAILTGSSYNFWIVFCLEFGICNEVANHIVNWIHLKSYMDVNFSLR